jgi:hypothetical protein
MSRVQPVSIQVAPTTEQKTEPGRFQRALRAAADGVAAGVASTVTLAAPYLPGGMVLSAAVRGATSAAGSATSGAPGGTATGTAAAAGEGDLVAATRELQQQSQQFNLQYLQLQESMQRESREFTALSNVMKVKHDTARASINNIH